MGRCAVWRALVGVCAAAALLVLGTGSASAQNFFHGVAFTKGCASPVNVGSPYTCSYQILNVVDTAHDTLTVTGLSDQVHAFTGDVNSGNILGSLQLVFSSPTVTCVGGSGAGTAASPYIGATSCTLPFGTSITSNDFTFYTVAPTDFNLALHQLTDTATLNWADLCDVGPPPPNGNCTTGAQTATAGSSATVNAPNANIQITPQMATNAIGTNHTLTGHVNVAPDGVNFVNAPDGTVITFSLTNAGGATAVFVGPSTCTTAGGTGSCTVVISSPTSGSTSIKAATDVTVNGVLLHRETGDGLPGDSPNAQKVWVGAAITIAPSATNPVNTAHTFTVTVFQDVNGVLTPAPGANVTVTCTAGNGATPTPPTPPSGTTNAAGQFTFTVNSPTAGTDTCTASATLTVNGVSITVTTNGTAPNSGAATKTWVDANIQITPPTATNPVNTNHTLTGHVNVNAGNGAGFVNAPDGTVITFTLANAGGATAAFVGPSTCTTAGGTGSCTVVINSPTAGSTTVHASTTVGVAGVSLTRETNGVGANSGDATKVWVNPQANIQISPLQATNPVGTNHTLTGHVNVAPDGVNFVNAPDGTVITFTLTNAGGATATFVGPSTCTTAGGTGSCTVVITSPTAGTTTIHAASDVTVGGVMLHVETNGTAGNSGDATKTWTGGNQGCTPGYWKNHPQAWAPSGFSPNQTLGSVFTNTGIGGTSLIAALSLHGGPTVQDAKNILLRAAVASLLNSAHSGVSFPLTTAQVIAMVNAALASNDRATILALASQLDQANNGQGGCPLN